MKLVIVVLEGVQALDVAAPMDVFTEANSFLPPDRHYHLRPRSVLQRSSSKKVSTLGCNRARSHRLSRHTL